MVQRVITERYDDLDGSPAVEVVRFGYADREYEIDLSEEHAAELDELLAPYVEHARGVDGGKPKRRARPAEGERRRRPEELRAIRQWARDQGLQVSERGRVPGGQRREVRVGAPNASLDLFAIPLLSYFS